MESATANTNETLAQAIRRANLLAAAAQVSQHVTQILDVDELLPKTVDIICDAYDFYYAGVFLINEKGDYAVLQAGRGEPGRIMLDNNHRLAVGGNSMIGACTALNEARISLDVDTEKVWYPNPVLPKTRSEMALPLTIGNRVIGAVTVQSEAEAAFSDEDIFSLQAMANQLAIAIDNARQRRELEIAHIELVQSKTFEAIATATGDAIHWIGNKAEPIKDSVERVRSDLQLLIALVADFLKRLENVPSSHHALVELLLKDDTILHQANPNLMEKVEKLKGLPLERLEKRLSLVSVLEDLQIIDEAGHLIMRVKEDLIGPAREHAPRPTMVDDVVNDTIHELHLSPDLVTISTAPDLPLAKADPIQLNRVFSNLLKNAQEALETQQNPSIEIKIDLASGGEFIVTTIKDNGVGITAENLDKIWVTFHSTKGSQRHTGLGLPAVRLIIDQIGGDVSVESEEGLGTIFTVKVPVYGGTEDVVAEAGNGRILLIDDNDRWQQFALATLTNKGYEVTTYHNDDNYAPYDLILVDDILAHSNTLQILLLAQGVDATRKMLMVSSNPRVERTKGRKLLGIYDLILKPYTEASLLKAVQGALTAINNN